MTHPTAGLDDDVHQRVRLGILAVLSEASEVDFPFLRDILGVTAGNLSRHLDVLAGSGLVRLRKGHVGRRSRTWISITDRGAEAFAAEVSALRALLDSVSSGPAAKGLTPRRRRVPRTPASQSRG